MTQNNKINNLDTNVFEQSNLSLNSNKIKSPKSQQFSVENYNSKKHSIENRTIAQNSRFMDVLSSPKQPSVSITYEEIGLFPRSFNRVFDRFFKQLFFDVENLVIQEYRFYRYLFLTTVKCVFILIFVPFLVNFICKNYLVKPITEYYWNSAQPEIFLNSYQQKRAFTELKDFEEKIYFESLIVPTSSHFSLHHSSKDNATIQNKVISDKNFMVSDNILISLPKISTDLISPLFNTQQNQDKSVLASCDMVHPCVFNDPESFLFSANSSEDVGQPSMTVTSNALKVLNPIKFTDLNSEISFASKIQHNFTQSKTPEVLSTNFGFDMDQNSNIPEKILENDSVNNSFNRFNYKLDQSIQKRLQQKTLELAIHYNEESIESITNFFADLISFSTLCFLLFNLEIQINITKSFLLEVFFGLDDSKKSLLILFVTDLLVGYHSPNIWELFFQSLFDHYGLPESQTTIFLLVATLPVLLDVLFKYLIFRHLNRASPATVATYHAMIE
uniref:Potassium/proton antiporter CemA n=1 Tax=Bracteacoccus aerius TaxID=50041 RepID=A0A140HAN0_9CHLO|nr:chloroplast envelope membrane protein [Bracteacoccus aerius]AMO01229.1 chloroplast envelope membrane protein [Bracteacoccus aerius]